MMKPAAPAPSSAPAEPYRGALVSVAAVDQAPRRLGECEAEYPPLARSQGIEGRVRLRLRIEADGRVGKVELLSGVGSGLDEAAMHAMRRCRFSPAKVAKEPVTTEITYTYAFVIEG